jgi:hypothetical protein
MTTQKTIAFLGTHGIPARHGAFEQTIYKLCAFKHENNLPVKLIVGCSRESKNLKYDQKDVERIFSYRLGGAGIIIYDALTSIKAYLKGARDFVYFGYEFSPFFIFFRLLGVNIICNVDGIEWRRAKWGRMPKQYFRFCEWIAARTANQLIFDAHGIARYFGINHGVGGHIIFYGSDALSVSDKTPEFEPGSYFSLVMRMEPENNIKTIIEGFQKSNSDRPLLLIGPSTLFFEQECLPLVDGQKVKYLGPIYDRERLLGIRYHSYAYIHGHSVGGTNPTLVEAIAIRNRVIAFNSVFNREVCGKNAHVIDADDFKIPPVLSSAYEWDTVADAYFKLCGVSRQEKRGR